MKTLYKKIFFTIDYQDPYLTTLIGKNANFIFNPNARNGEELTDFLSGCEEITDTSHQIEKLESDKAELLEALENTKTAFRYFPERLKEIESLIQKHNP